MAGTPLPAPPPLPAWGGMGGGGGKNFRKVFAKGEAGRSRNFEVKIQIA